MGCFQSENDKGNHFYPRTSCIKVKGVLVLVAHTCNPSHSGGRDQEDCSSKPTWAYSSPDPIWEKPITKKKGACGVAQGVGPEFKPQCCK
jgi:hypothetical protein